MDNMKISEELKDFIKNYEKIELKSYQDEAKVWTIGYGHTGKEVYPNMKITENQANMFLFNDLSKFGNAVNQYVKVPLSQNQFDALVAFSYNAGIGAFKNSTLLKKLNSGDFEGASEEFEKWNKITVNGEKKSSDGLSVRRYDEENIFTNNTYERTNIDYYRKNISNKDTQPQQSADQSQTDTEYINNELNKEKNIPEIDKSKLIADSDQIKTDGSSDYFVDEENKTIYYLDENGNLTQVTYEENSDLLIYGDPANPNKITFTDENGDYQVWQKDKDGNFVQTNKVDYSQVTNVAINQIGSLIIANNQNFSNIEKIAVSTSVGTIADFTSYAQSGKDFSLEKNGLANLQGAVVSFAVSAYFAKNDNIEINLIPFTLETKKRLLIIYNIINTTNTANNPSYLNFRNLFVC